MVYVFTNLSETSAIKLQEQLAPEHGRTLTGKMFVTAEGRLSVQLRYWAMNSKFWFRGSEGWLDNAWVFTCWNWIEMDRWVVGLERMMKSGPRWKLLPQSKKGLGSSSWSRRRSSRILEMSWSLEQENAKFQLEYSQLRKNVRRQITNAGDLSGVSPDGTLELPDCLATMRDASLALKS